MADVSSRTGRTEEALRPGPLQRGSLLPGETSASGGVLGVIRRRKWWILQALVLVPVLVMFATSRQEKKYTASAGLLFRDPPANVLNSSLTDPQRQAATNASLVVLPTIAVRAARLAGAGYTSDEVASAVRVEPTGDSDVVDIFATSPDPERAAAMANAYGEAYIAFRSAIDRTQLSGAIDEVRRGLDSMSSEERIGGAGQALRTQLDELELANSLATGNASLVQRADAPTDPSSPRVTRNLVLGIVLGGLLGLALAFGRDRFDQTLRSTEEIEGMHDAPILAHIPSNRRLSKGRRADDDADLEPFRTLRANLRYFGVTRDLHSILVSSPLSGDGKSTIALNLAMTMASMGDDVVLVEADLHKPSAFGPSPGLSAALSGEPVQALLQAVPTPATGSQVPRHLHVLPSGHVPPNPSELLESDRMLELLEELHREFEYVIIDSPALTRVSDSSSLVSRVSGVLVVSAIGQTRRAAAIQFRKQMDMLGGNVLGVVANRVDAYAYRGYGGYGGYGAESNGRR
jgi:succinoglycan biosynthesis transport protein ExoP